MLKQGLTLRGVNESIADPCVFIKQNGSNATGGTSTLSSDDIHPRGGTSVSSNNVSNPQIDGDAV